MRTRCLIGLIVLLAAGCNKGVSDKNLEYVSVGDADKLLDRKAGLLGLGGPTTGTFVDPRSNLKWAEGHIPGAVHFPFQFVKENKSRLAGYDTIIVYGDGYNDPLADGMSKRLIELGFKKVYTLRGGLKAWIADGKEVQTGVEGAYVEEELIVQ